MTRIQITTAAPKQPTGEIIPCFAEEVPQEWPQGLFPAKEAELLVVPSAKSPPQIFVGLGSRQKLSSGIVRRSILAAVRRACSIQQKTWLLKWNLPEEYLFPALTGACEGAYDFDTYKTTKTRTKEITLHLEFTTSVKAEFLRKCLAAVLAFSRGRTLCCELANAPGNQLPPLEFARRLRAEVKNLPSITLRVLEEKQLRNLKMGGILSVGAGSANPPCLILLHYKPNSNISPAPAVAKKNRLAPIVLVGKAITFDSGGICLKPSESMEEMKFDKSGGSAVAGILIAAARLSVQREIIGVIPAAENLPSHTAYRPGDIIQCYDGSTVEIINTDAEGRLILADALAFAAKTYKPSVIIDLATLTGACVVALGTHRAGLFSQNDQLKSTLLQSAEATGELLWPLPLDEPYYEQMHSKIATIKNSGGRWGGACTAAAFLSHFVPKGIPWAHIDIAGVAWNNSDTPHRPVGATGFGVSLLVHWLMTNDCF